MDPGTHHRGTRQHGPLKEPRQKQRSSRPKRGKQLALRAGSSVPPAASPIGGDGCAESPALSPLPVVCSAMASDGAPPQPSEPSKSPLRGGATKSCSSGAAALQPSPVPPAPAVTTTAVLNKSRPNLDATGSKPSDLDSIPGGTHNTGRAPSAAGPKASCGSESVQDQPAAPGVAASQAAAIAYIGGPAAADAPVAVSHRPLAPPQPAVQPPRPEQASRRECNKPKAASVAKNREVDVDNRLSAEESFTPASSRDATMKKTNVVSTSHWSFYPMNVTFVTEVNSEEQRYMYAAVGGVMVVVIALAAVVLVLLLSAKPHTQYVVCDTAECIEAHEYLAGLLNTSKDTCSDFYGYVCDSWLDRATDQDGPSSFLRDNMAASIDTISRRLLSQDFQAETEDPKDEYKDAPTNNFEGTEGTRALHALYHRCHSYVSEKTTAETFKATLTLARERLNWTLIRGVRTYRELVELTVRTSLLAGFHTVFALDLLSENSKTVLRLSSERSLLGKLAVSGNREELRGDLRRVVEDANERALVLSLDELIANDLDLGDDVAVEDQSRPLPALLENLVPEVTSSDWMVALKVAVGFGEESMRTSDMALESGAANIRRAFSKIYNHSTVSEAALYLASHLDADLLSLELSKERAAAHPSRTAHFCLDLARRCFGYAWPHLVARLLDLDRNGSALYAMFHDLKETSHHAAIFRWLSEKTWIDAVGKVEKTTLIVVTQEGTGGEPTYGWLARFLKEADSGDFVRLFLRVLEHEHSLRLRQPPTRLQLLLQRLEQRSQLAYVASVWSVLVPTLFQRRPLLYSVSVPTYFNYGTVGALLAVAIVEVVTPVGGAGSDKQQKVPGKYHDMWWTPATLRKYNESSHCLQRLYRRLGLHAQAAGSDEEQRRAMFLGAHGLRLAYDSLAASFRRALGNSDGFSTLWLRAQALFFTRFCLLWCNADQRPNPLSPRGNCLLPLHNMPEFDTAFECTERADFVSDNCVL